MGWITAIILTMMCTIDITPYALGVATFFSIFFGKLLFGGFGNNIFNPAAFGRAVIFNAFMGGCDQCGHLCDTAYGHRHGFQLDAGQRERHHGR